MTKETEATRGRPSTFADRDAKFAALVAIRDGADVQPSRFLKLQLAESGLLQRVTAEPNGRGRPAVSYTLTGKAKSWVALIARNAAKAAEKSAQA